MNPHSAEIDRVISRLKNSGKYRGVYIVNTSHADFVRVYGSNVFTNLIRDTFSREYLSRFPCVDCGAPSKERCHGIGDERPIILRRALERIYPEISVQVSLEDIVMEFLELHKPTKFTFKCSECHKAEGKPIHINSFFTNFQKI
jgi:hypothetical protein